MEKSKIIPRWFYKNEIERFESKFNKKTSIECWDWLGHINSFGYGVFRFDGKMGLAHRFAFDRLVRKLKANETVDHICFNRACCNPHHLQALSHKDNVARSTKKNRGNKFCKNNHEREKHSFINKDGILICRACKTIAARKFHNYQGLLPMGKRTHCPKGHEYNKDNTYLRKDRNSRDCKTCRKERNYQWWKKINSI